MVLYAVNLPKLELKKAASFAPVIIWAPFYHTIVTHLFEKVVVKISHIDVTDVSLCPNKDHMLVLDEVELLDGL